MISSLGTQGEKRLRTIKRKRQRKREGERERERKNEWEGEGNRWCSLKNWLASIERRIADGERGRQRYSYAFPRRSLADGVGSACVGWVVVTPGCDVGSPTAVASSGTNLSFGNKKKSIFFYFNEYRGDPTLRLLSGSDDEYQRMSLDREREEGQRRHLVPPIVEFKILLFYSLLFFCASFFSRWKFL